jgi:Zn-dependent metalloprotease
MNPRYGCVCFAVPQKLLRHLADKAGKSDSQRGAALHASVDHMSEVRAQRARHSAEPAAGEKGAHALHRRIYDADGQTFLPGTLLRDDGHGPVRDKAANQAYDNLGLALEFYESVLGRDSVDGKGMRIDASIHYSMDFGNAMWTGRQMIVGDGDGKDVVGVAQSLGIIAHELSHGVTQHLVKGALGVVLEAGKPPALKGEAGALNESFSDVFASMIKQWHQGIDAGDADWLVGEDILAPHAGKAVRSLKDPGKRQCTWDEDDQIKHYDQWKHDTEAHDGSGIANHAFYLAATRLEGKSWERLGSLWLESYGKLKPQATFRDLANATLDVAAARHAAGAAAHGALQDAWKQVGVLA